MLIRRSPVGKLMVTNLMIVDYATLPIAVVMNAIFPIQLTPLVDRGGCNVKPFGD
jgi:hypothetical protein